MQKNIVIVKTGSKMNPSVNLAPDGTLQISVREPAVDGKANKAVIESVARHFGVAKARVKIVRGASSKHKAITIDD